MRVILQLLLWDLKHDRINVLCLLPRYFQALDELLAAGADPNLPLAGRLGSALCTLANISYDRGPEARNQINLVFLFS